MCLARAPPSFPRQVTPTLRRVKARCCTPTQVHALGQTQGQRTHVAGGEGAGPEPAGRSEPRECTLVPAPQAFERALQKADLTPQPPHQSYGPPSRIGKPTCPGPLTTCCAMLTLDCPNVFGKSCFPSVFTVEGWTATKDTTPAT